MRVVLLLLALPAMTVAQIRAPAIRLDCADTPPALCAGITKELGARSLLTWRPGLDQPVRTAVLDRCLREGYAFAVLDSVVLEPAADSSVWTLHLALRSGPRTLFGAARVSGAASLPEADLLRALDLPESAPFSVSELESGIGRMLYLYDRHARPFADIAVDSVALVADGEELRVNLLLSVREGDSVRIAEITVEGNTQTRTAVVVREARIRENEPWDAGEVDAVRARLERTRLFAAVAEPRLYKRGDRYGLLLQVTEGSTNVFDGVVGYLPPDKAGNSGTVTGLVDLSFRNIFGTGRRLDAHWQRVSRTVSDLSLRYVEPWIFGLPVNLAASFSQYAEDSAYVRRTIEGRATYLAGKDFQLAAFASSIAVIPSVNGGVPGLQGSDAFSAGLELSIDTRDSPYNPLAGVQLRNSYAGGTKRFNTSAGVDAAGSSYMQRIEVDAWWFQSLLPRIVSAVSLRGRELTGDRTDVTDLYRLGGANSLRGYREDQFLGTRLWWSNLEARFTLGRRSYAAAFFDIGYIFLPEDPRGQWTAASMFRHGYGLGARLDTALGILGVSYALGQGDSVANGKIHVGLVNEF